MSDETLLETLERVAAEVSEVTRGTINYGGCGLLAAEVGKYLEARGIPCDVATTDGGRGYGSNAPAAEVRPLVKNPRNPYDWDLNGLGRKHLALRFKLGEDVYTWDSDVLIRGDTVMGEDADPAAGPFGTGLTVTECATISRRRIGWNRTFNRARHMPKIRAIIRKALSTEVA